VDVPKTPSEQPEEGLGRLENASRSSNNLGIARAKPITQSILQRPREELEA
jgi:hypothetical protein